MFKHYASRYVEALTPRWVRIGFIVTFALFVGSILFSVFGMLTLNLFPSTYEIFGPYYQELVQVPTWTYMVMLPILPILLYGARIGWWRIILFFAWGCLIGGGSELLGTTTGIPFGEYYYTHWLGPQIADHVPYFIPPSWFAMSVISLDLARRMTDSRWSAIFIGTIFMVLWDVALDPAMSNAFPFWHYPEGGFFYGMPLSNWIGWFVVTLIILVGYEYIGGGLRFSSIWAPILFALNCLFPIAISFLQGLPGAGAVGMLAMAAPLAIVYFAGREADDAQLHHTVSSTE